MGSFSNRPRRAVATRDRVIVDGPITIERVMRSHVGGVSIVRVSRHVFVITVTGELDERLRAEFEDTEVAVDHGVTRLRVAGADASALHGVLHRLEALGLELLDLREEGSPRRGDARSPSPRLPSSCRPAAREDNN